MARNIELKAPEGKFRLVIKEVDSADIHHIDDGDDREFILKFANEHNRERVFRTDSIYLVYDEHGNQLADEEKLKR